MGLPGLALLLLNKARNRLGLLDASQVRGAAYYTDIRSFVLDIVCQGAWGEVFFSGEGMASWLVSMWVWAASWISSAHR